MLHPRHAAGRVTALACLEACRDLGRSDLNRHPSQDFVQRTADRILNVFVLQRCSVKRLTDSNRRIRNRTYGGVGGRGGQPPLLPDELNECLSQR